MEVVSFSFADIPFTERRQEKHSPSGMTKAAAFPCASASFRPRQKALQIFEEDPWRNVVCSVFPDHRADTLDTLSVGTVRSDHHFASSGTRDEAVEGFPF